MLGYIAGCIYNICSSYGYNTTKIKDVKHSLKQLYREFKKDYHIKNDSDSVEEKVVEEKKEEKTSRIAQESVDERLKKRRMHRLKAK